VSLLNIAVFSTVLLLTFLLSDSSGPAAVDIHDVPIFPAAVTSAGVPAIVGLAARCCFTTSASIPTCAYAPTVLAVLLLLLFLLLLPFLLLWAVTLIMSPLLLLVDGVTCL
jgi:hypothetical protein